MANLKVNTYHPCRTPEPPEGATSKELLKAARRYWCQYGVFPEWYNRRKKELDKPSEVC